MGGGPAGSTLARSLSREGLDAVVLDRQEFPRDKVCAGWITPAVVAALELDCREYAESRILQPIHGFRIGVLGGPTVETRTSAEVLSYGIRRCEFDDYLLRRCGATLWLGQSFEKLSRRPDGSWLVDDRYETRLIVGAGGHFCPVARHLGAHIGGQQPVILAQEVEFEMTAAQAAACPAQPSVPELFFCRDLKGYGWLFRKGNFLNIGLGREDPTALARHVAEFRRWLIEQRRVPAETPERFHGHAYHLYSHPARRLVDDGVLLIGDAAGLAYPQSGEGIRPAVESALLAARAIRLAEGNYSHDQLSVYEEGLRARFGRRGRPPGLSRHLPAPVKRSLAGWLLTTEWFARRVVAERWFLHAHQAPLAA